MVRKINRFLNYHRKLILSICALITLGLVAARLIYLHWFGYIVWLSFTGLEDKDLWDLAELLIIPVTLAIVAAVLDRFERKTDREIAIERVKVDREIALDNQRETAIQNYFDAMTNLILDRKIRESDNNDPVREIAQVKTNTVFERLDNNRKTKIVRFLCEVDLVNSEEKSKPIIHLMNLKLTNAELGEVNLQYANIQRADLRGALLQGANLIGANMRGTNLLGANLISANLMRADMKNTNMKNAHLNKADLGGANLKGAVLNFADLGEINLRGAYLKNSDLSNAFLENADLNSADMNNALLEGANLKSANLEDTNLEGAKLEMINLINVTYNKNTRWPTGFDPVAAGAVLVEE